MGMVTVSLSALGTLVPLYAVREGASATVIGILVALPNVFPVMLALVAGRLVDAGGAGRAFVVGTAGMVLAPLLVTLVSGLGALALGQVLIGLFHLFVTLASQSFVADLSNGRSFERNFSWYSTSLAAGRMVGPVLVGLIVDLAGFRAAFAVLTMIALFTLTLAVAARRAAAATAPLVPGAAATPGPDAHASPTVEGAPRSAGRDRAPASTAQGADMRDLLVNPGVQLAILASSGVFVAIAVRQAFFPVYLQSLDHPASTIGALLSLGAFAAVLVRPLMPLVSRLFGGPARTLVVAMAAVAVSVGLLGTVQTLLPLVALTMLAGFGTGVGMPLSIVSVATHVVPARRGVALALRLSANRTAQLVAPVAIGALVGAAGFGAGFALAGGLLAVATVAAMVRVPAFERAARTGRARADV